MKLEDIERLYYWLTSNQERIDGLWDRDDFNEHNREFIKASRTIIPDLLAIAKASKSLVAHTLKIQTIDSKEPDEWCDLIRALSKLEKD